MRPSAALLQSPRLLCWLQFSGRGSDDSVPEGGFKPPQVLANRVKVGTKLLGMLKAVLPDFRYKRVFHGSSPKKASGGTISGHSYPAFSTVCRIIIFVNGLLICEKFQVAMNSIPEMAAMAT